MTPINPLTTADKRKLRDAIMQANVAEEYINKCAACGLPLEEEMAVTVDLKNRLQAIQEHFGDHK